MNSHADQALVDLLILLKDEGYRFVTPTPATHARVLAARASPLARDLRDVLGWSLPFAPGSIRAPIEALLDAAGMLAREDGLSRSTIRVSSLGDTLFLHSAYPTGDADAVFFGPDSYRFADFIATALPALGLPPESFCVDIGTGTGVGAFAIRGFLPEARVTMTDINPLALRFAGINARAAGLAFEMRNAGDLAAIGDPIDLAIANPPYIIDPDRRAYRDGGDLHGAGISIAMTRDGVSRLSPRGHFLLYTGSAIIAGRDRLRETLVEIAETTACKLTYREIDPDIFGEELEKPYYRGVERIALIGATLSKVR